uniref:Uncharacterized protein n=1 Tax=Anguilla anguilla TaxID=7936 RepID=A0A0E9V854_ANGAN
MPPVNLKAQRFSLNSDSVSEFTGRTAKQKIK